MAIGEDKSNLKAHQKDKDLAIIKTAFENGKIEKMSDLEKLSSTKIAFLAGINQGRYASKLFHPEKFSIPEIIRISIVLELDESFILKVIKKQLLKIEMETVLKNKTKYLNR
ncbi:hypothetical protein [Mucilaginibacter psychrotolerans]|uniref:Uncharacterized protein n=1 Tax=Mucilaginibacter psychrotolerans TaxID=1524096 RepID=A0A4Y8SH03_9SPHI|nr:hypothetical protein [Mucilaginibacter psychrotolerans]TFF37696.1 hypothetical protein E2R66_11045 [Mucilaginibacter psychrotolerans]